MSILMLDELKTTLSQKVTATKLTVLGAIRPHLYIEGSPPGDLRVDIYDAADTVLLQSSEQISIASIKTQAEITQNYFHGYVRFLIDWGIADLTEVTIRLVGLNGYVFGATDLIGWCKDFDLRRYQATYSPNTEFDSAFDVELWQNKDSLRKI